MHLETATGQCGGLDVPTEGLDTPVLHCMDWSLLLVVVGDGVIPKGAPYIRDTFFVVLCSCLKFQKLVSTPLTSSSTPFQTRFH